MSGLKAMTMKGAAAAFVLALLPSAASAQSAIAGAVRDATGAVLPGVTIEAASPALIEKTRVVATDQAGQYTVVDLRPGVYIVTFTLPGFNTIKREGIELTAGFTATVNAELRVGDITETLTVSGQSPIVDLQTVTQHQALARDVIDNIPSGRTYGSLVSLVTGIVTTPGDVGGSTGEAGGGFNALIHGGRAADMVLEVDGLRYQQPGAGNLASLGGFDSQSQEINYEVGSLSAEWATGGVRVNMIPKEGSNSLHGGFYTNWTGESLQSDNLTAELKASGVPRPDALQKMWDIHPEFGGPFIKDKLWFYAHFRYWGIDKYPTDAYFNQSPNPLVYVRDVGRPGLQVSTQSSLNLRTTWQATPRNKIALYMDRQTRVYDQPQYGGVGATPATWHHQEQPTGYIPQAKWSSPVTNKLLLEAGMTYYRVHWVNHPEAGTTSSDYSVYDQGIGRTYGAAPFYFEGNWGGPLPSAAATYVTGTHAFKVGFSMSRTWQDVWTVATNDMNLTTLNGSPIGVTQWATPILASTNLDADLGIYAQDKWTLRRLTLNLGVRLDYLKGSIPAQHVGPTDIGTIGITSSTGRYLPVKDFAAVDNVPNLRDLSPRLGISYDLFGNGKTALKASVSRYVGAPGGTSSPGTYNPLSNMVQTAARSWTDNNGDGIPQEVELGAFPNNNFGKAFVNTAYDDAVRQGWFSRSYNWEESVSVQHELVPRVSVEAAYFRRTYGNFTATKNLDVTPSDYDSYCIAAPTDSRLAESGQQICGLYDINPSKFGQVHNFTTLASNYGKQYEHWNGFDFTARSRFSSRGFVQVGLSTGKTTTDNCEVVANLNNPGTRFCHVETPFLTLLKVFGSYTLPWDVQVGATFQSVPGPQLASSYAVPTAQISPSLGRDLAGGVRTATVALLQPGTEYGDRLNEVDFRVSKVVKLGGGMRIQPEMDIFNLLNASPALMLNPTYGQQWLRPTSVLLGRFVKFGARFTF